MCVKRVERPPVQSKCAMNIQTTFTELFLGFGCVFFFESVSLAFLCVPGGSFGGTLRVNCTNSQDPLSPPRRVGRNREDHPSSIQERNNPEQPSFPISSAPKYTHNLRLFRSMSKIPPSNRTRKWRQKSFISAGSLAGGSHRIIFPCVSRYFER